MVPETGTKRPEVSVILPMYNEAGRIGHNIRRLLEELKGLRETYELIFVNDGSTDHTASEVTRALSGVASARLISYAVNRGRGYALRKGFEEARGRFVITTESDLSWGPGVVLDIYRALENTGAEAIIVSPYLRKNGLRNVPLARRLLSSIGNRILTFGLSGNLTMVTGMTRGYKRETIDSILLQMNGKEIHLEIVSKLLGIGAEIVEIPGTIAWEKSEGRGRRRQAGRKTRRLILTHLYFSVVESPIHFIGLFGVFFMAAGLLGVAAIIVLKVVGFPLLRIPFFPHYVIAALVVGLVIFVFSLLSSQITKLERELIRVYAQLAKLLKQESQKH